MSACRRYRTWLIDSLDGTLAPGAAERLRDHLAHCPACATALEDQRRIREALRTLPAVDPPPWLEDRILVRLHTGQAPRRRGSPRWLRAGLPAAAVLVFGLTGYLVLHRPGGPGRAPVPGPEPRAEGGPALPAPSPAPGPGASTGTGAPAATGTIAGKGMTAGTATTAGTGAPAAPPPSGPPAAAPSAGTAAPTALAQLPAPGPEAGGRARLAPPARADGRAPQLEAAPPAARAKAAPAGASLAWSWEPRDPIRAPGQAQAAFEAAGARILSRPGPDYRGITAQVPGPALDALLARLEALGPVQDAPARPIRLGGEVLVTMTW